ncbi:N-acetylmuramoyl-L-alanine amidase family protein [Tenacibaculum aquimarinum]|uniref:N-acetylmuramoyl-L-alanine amidase family protein n=1 Tax=Tenacibaculum aquimarinum TaxID=2910675 RepID=UPI001F0B2B3B|nr:N-acetylmuramoyl-L-alanine amidase [Tenacibaculum aquimarinum]MCH3884731.1 N-acetylmuramoyl-L-alanine amidase [Tenacibaculum aquimarinum]
MNKILGVFIVIISFLLISPTAEAQKQYTIVLDAGHGGKDPGNLGNGYKEKDIALKVTLKVGEMLSDEKDIKVIYTRKTDVYPNLWKRGEIANKAKADLFVSIHCDSYQPRPEAHGAGTFVLGLRGNKKNFEIAKRENAFIVSEENYKDRYEGFDPNSSESVIGLSLLQEENLDKSLQVASIIQTDFTQKAKRKDRKVKQDNFQVLRETVMPSVLIELGFLTNKEGAFLNSKKGQIKMATSIAKSIKEYINQLKLNTVVTDVLVENTSDVEFKIQIASGKNKIATKSYNFKGLQNVERIKIGSFYKYYYGNTSDYQQVKKSLSKAKQKGYKDAFVIALKNGEKVSVQDAISNQ